MPVGFNSPFVPLPSTAAVIAAVPVVLVANATTSEHAEKMNNDRWPLLLPGTSAQSKRRGHGDSGIRAAKTRLNDVPESRQTYVSGVRSVRISGSYRPVLFFRIFLTTRPDGFALPFDRTRPRFNPVNSPNVCAKEK